MQQRSRQCNLQTLSLRETGRAAIDDVLHAEQFDHIAGTGIDCATAHAVQLAKIAQVLTGTEPFIEANLIGQNAHVLARRDRVGRRVDAIDADAALIAMQQTEQDA